MGYNGASCSFKKMPFDKQVVLFFYHSIFLLFYFKSFFYPQQYGRLKRYCAENGCMERKLERHNIHSRTTNPVKLLGTLLGKVCWNKDKSLNFTAEELSRLSTEQLSELKRSLHDMISRKRAELQKEGWSWIVSVREVDCLDVAKGYLLPYILTYLHTTSDFAQTQIFLTGPNGLPVIIIIFLKKTL